MYVRLVKLARAGDHAAFRQLVDLESHRCYAVAYRIVRDVERAQDAVQQALLLAWRELPRLRDPVRFEPWLFRLLVRTCYEESRRFRGWSSRTQALVAEPRSNGDFTRDVANRDAIDRAFRRLSPQHRSVMVLHHYLGMPVATMADVVGVPVGTVKSRLHHATRALRSALDADDRVQIPEELPG